MMHVSQARLHSSRTIGVGTIGGSADYGALFQVGILTLVFCCNVASETLTPHGHAARESGNFATLVRFEDCC